MGSPEGEKPTRQRNIRRRIARITRMGMPLVLIAGLTGVAYEMISHSKSRPIPVSTITEYPSRFPGTITVGPADELSLRDLHNPVSRGGPARFVLDGGQDSLVIFVQKGQEKQLNQKLAAGQAVDLTGKIIDDGSTIQGLKVDSVTTDS